MNGDPREHGEDDELDHQKTDKPDGKEFHCRVVRPLMKHDEKRDYRGDEGEEQPNRKGAVGVDIREQSTHDTHDEKEKHLFGRGKGGRKQKRGRRTAAQA